MSLEIKKGNSAGVNSFLVKRGELVKHLVLQDCSIDPQLAEAVAGKLTSLQSVTVDCGVKEQEAISDDDIVSLQRMCSTGSLSKLSLNRVNNVSISVIDNFISNFGTLTNLSLSYCTNFSDESLANVAASCRNLRVISLRCTMIGDDGLSGLSKHCSSLISADFSECRRVTDIGVECVAQNNRDLQEISVDKCPGITETTLVALAKGCQNMQAISMEATGIRKLPSAVVCLNKLKQLKLLGCTQLTHPPVEIVQQASTPAGVQQLLNFFLDFQLTYRIKVFVIGEQGVGKSALIRCLTFDNPLLIPQRNTGFSGVSLWDPSSLGSIGKSAKADGKYIFEIWELPDDIVGLGDIFYIEPAIYIVAFDLIEPSGIDSVIRNVLSVWARFPNACVLVVGTHADALDPDALKAAMQNTQQRLSQLLALRGSVAQKHAEKINHLTHLAFDAGNLPPICERQVLFLNSLNVDSERATKNLVHAVSCRSRQGIADLRQTLLRHCSEHATFFPQFSHVLTPALVQLYEDICQLRSRSTIILAWSEFAYFAERAGIPTKDIERDTNFLHNAGVIFDFRYLATSLTISTESYICIDPSRFLELFNSMHTSSASLAALGVDETAFSSLLDRGEILGRMLPSLWKLTDTDQLESLELLARRLGVICPIPSALPPAGWDKLLPPLPLGAHRCAFIRRVYSFPHFYDRLLSLARPIHWQPELAADDCELSVSFGVPGELISILESSFHRIIAALPSLHSACSKAKSELMLNDWDLSKGTMLMRFTVENTSNEPVEVFMNASLSKTDGISVSARVNNAEFSPSSEECCMKAALVLWFYCLSLARDVYNRIVDQLGGVPMSIKFKSSSSATASKSLSLPELLIGWINKDGSILTCPPVPYPSSTDFESLTEMFDYLLTKLRAMLMNEGLHLSSRPASSIPFGRSSPPVSVIGDGIIVNDGCFRRGKSKRFTVQFLDNYRNRGPSVSAITDSLTGSAIDCSQQFWTPAMMASHSGHPAVMSYGSRTLPVKPGTLLQASLLGKYGYGRMQSESPLLQMSAQYDSRLAASDIDVNLNSTVGEDVESETETKDTLSGDFNDFTDHLSVLSTGVTNHTGSLPSLDYNNQRGPKRVSYVEKHKRKSSPPPKSSRPDNNGLSQSTFLAREEECNDLAEETIVESRQHLDVLTPNVTIHAEDPHSGFSSSSISLSSPKLPSNNKQQRTLSGYMSTDDEKTRLSPTSPVTKSYVREQLLTPNSSSNTNKTTASQSLDSNRSSPLVTRSGGNSSSVGEDSGLVGYEEEDEEKRRNGKTSTFKKHSKLKDQLISKMKSKENGHADKAADAVLDNIDIEIYSSAQSREENSPRPEKRKAKKNSFSFRRRKSSDTKLEADSVGNLLNANDTMSYRSKKDRTKCLCS